MKNILLENYIKSFLISENDITNKVIYEIILDNNYKNYNQLDENVKTKIKNALNNLILYGTLAGTTISGLAAGGISTSDGLDKGKAGVAQLIDTLSQNNDESIKASIKLLTQGDYKPNKKLNSRPHILKQLAIIMSNRDGSETSSFIIVDDINNMLYHFTPKGIVNFESPVITGRDLDEKKISIINFSSWLDQTGKKEDFTSGSKRVQKKLFDSYLAYVDKMEQKITPTGVYSITQIKQVGKKDYDQDHIAYGRVGKLSFKKGINSPISATQSTAIHGTGIKGRKAALKKARVLARKGKYKAASRALSKVNSYGCINLEDSQLKKLIKIISSNNSTIVYVMSDDGDGVVNFGGSAWENTFASLDFIIKGFEGAGIRAYNKFRKLVGAKPSLEYDGNKKFRLK